ncbi:MAG: hypothetical protein ACJA1B_000008 [Polaribacter sp.]|jgi:hypothetical protein
MKKAIHIFVTLSLVLFFTACNFSTANIDDVKMCTNITDNQCPSDNPVFSTTSPLIYVSCHLNNAPENTDVKMEWIYLGEQRLVIDAVLQNSGSNIGNLNIQSNLSKPTNGWPIGDYEIVLTIVGTDKEPNVKTFSIQ